MNAQQNNLDISLEELPLHERCEMVKLATGFYEGQIVSFGEQIEHDQTQSQYTCPICLCLPRAPVTILPSTRCPHTFCVRCVTQLIKYGLCTHNPHLETRFGCGSIAWTKCPLCLKKVIGPRTVTRWRNWEPRLKADWEQIRLCCVWPGCGKVDSPMNIARHEMSCHHRPEETRPTTAAAHDDDEHQPTVAKKQASA